MSFYEVKFRSSLGKEVKTQVYKATDVEDCKRQHERTNQLMSQGLGEEYTAEPITISEVTSKSKIKRLESQWRR